MCSRVSRWVEFNGAIGRRPDLHASARGEPIRLCWSLGRFVLAAESPQSSLNGVGSVKPDFRTEPAMPNAVGARTESFMPDAVGSGTEPKRGDAPSTVSTRRTPWADLLQRVFEVDALCCPRCGGRMHVLAAIAEPDVAQRILAGLKLPTRAPPLATSRPFGPTQGWPEREAPSVTEADAQWSGFDFDQSARPTGTSAPDGDRA
jgi:hypothetical protein